MFILIVLFVLSFHATNHVVILSLYKNDQPFSKIQTQNVKCPHITCTSREAPIKIESERKKSISSLRHWGQSQHTVLGYSLVKINKVGWAPCESAEKRNESVLKNF